MGWRLACGIIATSLCLACGGRTDLLDIEEGGTPDASLDAKPLKDASKIDVSTVDVYQPLGKKCSQPTGTAPPAWTPDDAGAPLHPPYIASSGGSTIANPQFVAITFDGDDMRDSIEDFLGSVGCTDYWRSIVRDYGINDAWMIGTAHLKDKPPATIDDSQIGAFIRSKITSKELPAYVPNQTLYVIFYPDTTDITLQGLHSCQGFGGYHNEAVLFQSQSFPYAVLPRCGSFGQLGGLDALTYATSHELVEAATDQFPESSPAYQFPEPDDIAWGFGGGEIGDMCEYNEDAPLFPTTYPFTVQKQWVSSKAWLLHDPCQPSTQTYFAAAPVLPDMIAYDFGVPSSTKGVKIGVGAQKTIDLKLVADGAFTSDILVDVQDASFFFGQKASLNFNVNPKSGKVGDTIKLTISRIGTNQQFGLEPFLINAHSNGIQRSWWALVGDP